MRTKAALTLSGLLLFLLSCGWINDTFPGAREEPEPAVRKLPEPEPTTEWVIGSCDCEKCECQFCDCAAILKRIPVGIQTYKLDKDARPMPKGKE